MKVDIQRAFYRVFLAMLFAGEVVFGQQPPVFRERVNVSVVSFWVTANTPLSAEELEVELDGARATILALEPGFVHEAPPSSGVEAIESAEKPEGAPAVRLGHRELLFVIPNNLCSRFCLTAGARFLAENAERLVALGAVTVVVARYSGAEVLRHALTDAASLKDFAEGDLLQLVTRNDLLAERRWFLEHIASHRLPLAQARSGVPMRLRPLLGEGLIVREFLAQVRMAVAQGDASKPRLVFLLSDGFGLEGYEVWDRFAYGAKGLDVFPWEVTARQWERLEGERSNYLSLRGFTEELAAEGVMVFPIFTGFASYFAPTWAASFGGGSVFRDFMTVGYTQGSVGSGLAVEDPIQGLRMIAEETGGQVVPVGKPFGAPSAYPYLVTCQVNALPDGQLHKLEVRRVRGQGQLWVPKLVRFGNSEAYLEGRARRLLRGEQDTGELVASVALANTQAKGKKLQGTLSATVNFEPVLETLTKIGVAKIRVLVAVGFDKEVFLHRAEFSEPAADGAGALWTFNAPIEFPRDAKKLAMVVEEVQTGAWGAAVMDLGQEAQR